LATAAIEHHRELAAFIFNLTELLFEIPSIVLPTLNPDKLIRGIMHIFLSREATSETGSKDFL
jgi:hypothetical protein